ncbi:type II toxin-antitoxin system PemK/MazF family toxin [Clostridium sp.]|uniref:type II toxin-antitoxin system PemK/MazF family toxin n=1 Tax=Clostridium sp. TaxID=1506 RepID=UPI001DAFB22A|nr:type II toxin-antitoxin system PemK/MazF family toxin [Clostridium sp.]MBS5307711.1 type II toxin-antitoxin system PemK/MazF family toxin [Clostridium sp.]
MITRQVRRGDIFWFNFGKPEGSQQSGKRPAMVIQNDIGNKYSPTVIICAITSEIKKKELPTHVLLEEYSKFGLDELSQVMVEQTRTTDKVKLGDYIGRVDSKTMKKINRAIEISMQVGSASDYVEPREVKSVKVKAETIKTLDSFLVEAFFSSGERNMKAIEELVQEREDRLKDLERFASSYNINYKEYYNPMIYGNLERMVG